MNENRLLRIHFSDFQQNKRSKNLVKWRIFRNFMGENQLVMKKFKPLDQNGMTIASAHNHTAKVQNKIETEGSILDRLMDFAASVPDFRRTVRGNIRHRLKDWKSQV